MNRFFVNPDNVGDEYVVIDKKEDVNHINRVLRLRSGDLIEISDGKKWEYAVEIVKIGENTVEGKIIDKSCDAGEPKLSVTLFQGIPKKGKMELIIQKNIEIGISNIVPVKMDRSIGKIGEKVNRKKERYNAIAEAAAKQSKRGIIPAIEDEISFNEMIKNLGNYDLVLFPYEGEENLSIKEYLKEKSAETEKIISIGIIIGPEGGFSDKEVNSLKKLGVEPVSLGKTILRTETAGLVALSMIMYEFEI